MKVPKGTILALTTGEYSDYCLTSHVRALKTFKTEDLITLFVTTANYLENDDYSGPSAYGSIDRFIAWAIREGYIEPLDPSIVTEWHLGSYSKLGVPEKAERLLKLLNPNT